MTAKKRSQRPATDSTATVKPAVDHPEKKLFEARFWADKILPAALLFLAAVALYISSVNFEYVLDDKIVVQENTYVAKGLAGIKEILTTESFQGYFGEQKDLVEGGRYRPLSIVTFAVEHQFFGLNSKVSHFFNVLLYALTGLLLYRVLCLFFPLKNEHRWWLNIPFLTSLLFVLHPLHSEVVANVKGRDEILCLLGALAAVYLVWRYLASQQYLWLLLAALAFFLSLMAKETALTFIAIVPLSIYFFTSTPPKKILLPTLSLLTAALLYLLLRWQVIGYFLSSGKEITDIMNNPFYGLSTGEKLATIFQTLGIYLKLLIFPHPLTHDYYPYHIPVVNWGNWKALLSLALHFGLVAYAVWQLNKKTIISYGILFYFITLSIVSNLPFSVGTFMNERFLYIPSIGFCIIIGWLIARKLPEWTGPTNLLSPALLGCFVLGFGGKTLMRVPDWATPFSLNSAAIKVSTESARANLFMSTALFEQYKVETDQSRKYALLDDINVYLNKSLKIYPRYGSALTFKSGIVAENYQRDKNLDQLLEEFYQLLVITPNFPFIDQYMDYLVKREDADKLARFCLRVGAHYANEKRNSRIALKFLEGYGLTAAPNDRPLNRAVGQIYEKIGQPNKAAQYLIRAQ
ncbi:MAG: hypothetical protein AAGG75_00320 [Bacteroidota bacterium]